MNAPFLSANKLRLIRSTAGSHHTTLAGLVQATNPIDNSATSLDTLKMPKQRKLHKCRHCGFETEKKVENWQHIRVHIRPEKLLTCPDCQFVTEYKHHLEYHQRNHSGYKPFKCENCNYQCVNKSMLNSHMKSHSSICQYQCGDCKYATKYVHSLKMHLHKYDHHPTQIMIDVCGPKSTSTNSPSSTSSSVQEQCVLDLRVDRKNSH